MAMYSKYSLLAQVRPGKPSEVWVASSGSWRQCEWMDGGEEGNEISTRFCPERNVALQFQRKGGHPWLLRRRNGPARWRPTSGWRRTIAGEVQFRLNAVAGHRSISLSSVRIAPTSSRERAVIVITAICPAMAAAYCGVGSRPDGDRQQHDAARKHWDPGRILRRGRSTAAPSGKRGWAGACFPDCFCNSGGHSTRGRRLSLAPRHIFRRLLARRAATIQSRKGRRN